MIYQQPAPADKLEQGDILKKSEDLLRLLSTYHPHYASREDNKFFVVLTQSCDLVQRNGKCAARYISLAPVRPLKTVLKREFEGKLKNVGAGAQPFSSYRMKASFEMFLNRLFNNNEPPFFYYEAANENEIYEEMCALLALPISLKPEHYETLRAAKLGGITDVFQAKLGWLLGQMYSRVGTPDLDPGLLSEKVKSYTQGIATWLDEAPFKEIVNRVEAYQNAGNGVVGSKELKEMIRDLPKQKNQVIDAVLRVATSEGLCAEVSDERRRLRRALESDSALARLFTK